MPALSHHAFRDAVDALAFLGRVASLHDADPLMPLRMLSLPPMRIHAGVEIEKATRRDQSLFDKAYGYIRQYY